MQVPLQDIRAKFERKDHDGALTLINQYLQEHPSDVEAHLLKVEMCLQTKTDYAYVGATLETMTPSDDAQAAQIDRLKQQCEERAWEAINVGRGRTRNRFGLGATNTGDSVTDFESAIQLCPNDPVISFSAALFLLRQGQAVHNNPFEPKPAEPVLRDGDNQDMESWLNALNLQKTRSVPLSSTNSAAVERYLRRVIQLTKPGERLYEVGVVCLVRHWLVAGKLTVEGVTLLESLGEPHKSWIDIYRDMMTRVVNLLHDTTAGFLRAGDEAQARQLLKAFQREALVNARLLLLDAEGYASDSPARGKAYRKALRASEESPATPTMGQLKPLLKLAQSLQYKCRVCGREIRANSETCQYCESKQATRMLLIDRYHLRSTDQVEAAAHVGLAESLEASGNREKAFIEVERAQRVLQPLRNGVPIDQRASAAVNELHERLKPTQAEMPKPEEEPTAGRAWYLLADDDVTQDVSMRIARINDHQPEMWMQITASQRAVLIRRLIDAGQLNLAREAFALAFADHAAPKTAVTVRKALERAIDARLTEVYAEVEILTREGKPESALTLLSDALALRDDARLHLARGEARLAMGHDLQALGDFYSISEHADVAIREQARKMAVGILERRWDIEGARLLLNDLSDEVFVTRAKARLERRAKGEPAIVIEPVDEAVTDDTLTRRPASRHYHGYFAVVVREVGIGGDEAFYRRLGSAHFGFIQLMGAQRDLAGRAAFSMRIISEPHHLIPARGKITVAVVARVSADSEATCKALALSLWGDLNAMLPLSQENVYIYEPVVDEDELHGLLSPFEPVNVAEIARREGASGNLYTVNSFITGTPDFHNVFWMLMRQPAPAMISVQVLPTTLYAWERLISEERPDGMALLPPESGLEAVTPSGYSLGNMKRQLAQQQQWQKLNIADQRMLYLQNAFVLRVYVAGSEGTSQLLPEMAASTLFGPLQDGGINGGYQINRPAKLNEVAVVRRNLRTLDVESWGSLPDDLRLARLRYLVGEGEAAGVFRLPIPHSGGVPGMTTLEGKALVPPVGMPENGARLGVSVARVRGVPVPITQGQDDRRRHSYVVGKTGMGKSTLLQTLILQDIEAGRGVFLLDPHGDLCDDVLARIPSHRADDVILLDPSDESYPIGLNILQTDDEADRDRVVNDFIGLLMRLYDPHNYAIVGPIFQQTVRNAMLAVMSMPNGTLVDVYRLVSDSDGSFVAKVLPYIKDPIVRNYYEDVAKRMRDASSQWKAEYLPYILSKFSRFVEDATLRRMIGQTRSGIPFDKIMDEGKILLVNLAKGRIGEQNALFIGSLILTGVMQAAFKRSALPPNRRRDYFLYIDEVQNFATPTLATMLSEGRKFGVVLTIANQYLHQLNPQILEAVFGNIGSIVAFRLGIQDTAALGLEFYPSFAQQELSGLPQFTAAVKLLIDGVAARPFTMRTLPSMIPPEQSRAEAIRDATRQRYGTPLAQVEEEIARRFA